MATALVTGGTSGIGATFARTLAARGNDLILVARDKDRLDAMAEELTAAHQISVEVLPADLSVREQMGTVAARIEDPDRPVDLLVNNAGFGLHSRLLDPDTSTHERALDVMCLAVLVLGGAAGRAMRERGRGAIVNVSSTAGFVTMGHYSAVKGWVITYSEGLANELHGTGVQVTALCPGWVRTEFHERAGISVSKLPDPVWIDGQRLVDECLADVANRRLVSIPTKRYKVAIFLARHAPRAAIRAVSRRLSSSRHN
ncbi:MAG: SDR family NAD(P)-dependent oxidoreductase [Propionibacteriaceae bacterium]